MSLDSPSSAPPHAVPAIENELPTYRAISPMSVASLVFGVLSVLCFADLKFLVCPVLALVTGLAAQRTIRRLPDIYTGTRFVKTGLVLALVFGLSASTFTFVRHLKVRRSAEAYAAGYTQTLQSGDLAAAYWERVPFMNRQGNSPQAALEAVQKPSNEPMSPAEMYLGPIQAIQKRVAETQKPLRFVLIENYGFEGLTPYAAAVVEVPPEKGKSEPEYALVVVRSNPEAPGFEWMVSDISFPYKKGTFQPPEPEHDDGHGHAH